MALSHSLHGGYDPACMRICGLLSGLFLGIVTLYFALGLLMYTIVNKGSCGRTVRFGTMFSNDTFGPIFIVVI